MIVKIQQSLVTNAPTKQMLIYDEIRSVFEEVPLTKAVAKALKGRPKAYFKVNLKDDNIDTLEIIKEVARQNW